MNDKSNHKFASMEWLRRNEKFREEVDNEFLKGNLSYDESIERIWKIVNFFGDDYKEKNIISTALIGNCDYEGQGEMIIMAEKDVKISGYKEVQEKILILRNPDRRS